MLKNRPILGHRRSFATLLALMLAFVFANISHPRAEQTQPQTGVTAACVDHFTAINLAISLASPIVGISQIITDILADEGWVWVEPNGRRIRSVSGKVHNVHVANNDLFANHDSHDVDFELRVDPEQEDMLSPVSGDADEDHEVDSIGIEWESGIRPDEKTGDGENPTFPNWAWPSDGDRAWVDGNWIYDCAHQQDGLYHTEIHPPRAMASMRNVSAPLPFTGTTPVPVTKTDLYIHGRGGYVTQILNCGMGLIFDPFADCGTTTTSIEAEFAFDVCLPTRPPNGLFNSRVETGPRNTVAIEPQITLIPAGGGCLTDPQFDQQQMAHVVVPLQNTGTPSHAVYARHIYTGWITAPDPVLPHRRLTLESMDLKHENDNLGDGELSFMWINVDRAEHAWIRMNDVADGNMNDYDDEGNFGDGEMTFTEATFDFYLRPDQTFTFRSNGMEQDCMDDWFGFHFFLVDVVYPDCYVVDAFEIGVNDSMPRVEAVYTASELSDLEVLKAPANSSDPDYLLRVKVEEVPLADEDTSDLAVSTSCSATGEVALVGVPLTCTSQVNNGGPGMPRRTIADANFATGVARATVNSASWSLAFPFLDGSKPCTASGVAANCAIGTVPVSSAAKFTVVATPTSAGELTETTSATTASTDPYGANNMASTTVDVFQPIAIDIEPMNDGNEINLTRGGTMTVAVLTTATFDATTVRVSTLCFGDSDAAGERVCFERHGQGHFEDINKDKRLDLVLHYEVDRTGIDRGDIRACLKGRTLAGVGIYGCDAIVTK